MRGYLRERKNKLGRVTVTVERMVVNVVDMEAGSATREEVRGPWAATREPAARRKTREHPAGMVGGKGGAEEEERSAEERHVLGRKSRGKGQENQT